MRSRYKKEAQYSSSAPHLPEVLFVCTTMSVDPGLVDANDLVYALGAAEGTKDGGKALPRFSAFALVPFYADSKNRSATIDVWRIEKNYVHAADIR
jgi:hypothetical protein